jgi:hypothetical protein
MSIPASQLETWSHQGSIAQSKQTYAIVKNALEAVNAPYTDRDFTVFLQGSYGNDTNIWAESDVDLVIRYDGAYYYDLDALSDNERAAFHLQHPSAATYAYSDFKKHVLTALTSAFGDSVRPGTKAIKIEANSSRRSADVVVAFQHRRYHRFAPPWVDDFTRGITFTKSDGTRIHNFPNQHCENLTTKHQATGNLFKPMARIFKNMRSKLVDDKIIASGIAPSYYVEGLLYNVPDQNFVTDQSATVFNILKWLSETKDRTKFLCANERYYLLRDGSQVSWPTANGPQFINAAINLWNKWT